MPSRTRTPRSERLRRSRGDRSGWPCVSEKQTRAYLMARDALRRIQRVSSLLVPPSDGGLQMETGRAQRSSRIAAAHSRRA